MKKISVLLIALALLLSVLSLGSCLFTASDYRIVVNPTANVKITDAGFEVEADTTVTIPQGEVYDKNGSYCDDFTVTREITDESGNRKAGTLQMKHGEVYTVKYSATNGERELSLEMKLYAYDTILPTLSLLNIQQAYNVGDTVTIKVNDISKDVDYESSTFVLKNETSGEVRDLSFTEAYSFTAQNESESYSITASLCDVNGNTNVIEHKFVILGNFTDENIAKNDIWDFDEIGYINNIKLSGGSDSLNYSIVTDGLPEDKNSLGIGTGALKLELRAGERYSFTLVNGNGFKIEDCSKVGFRVWADKVVDIFELYNVDDNSMQDLSWKITKRGQWQNVEFDPLGAFSYDYVLESLKLIVSCEEDVTLYIDSVYWVDYEEPWRDEDLPEGELAIFDDEGYLERITEALNSDSTTFGGSWQIVKSVPETTDFTGGVLRFVSTSDASLTSDKNARDGFKFQFFDKLSYDEIEGLIFRLYCVDENATLAISFIDQKMGETPSGWYTLGGATGKWINVVIPKESLKSLIEGFNNITHINIRFIRPNSASVEGQEEYVTYIDKISLYGLDYDKVEYTFADEYDMRTIENVNYTTGVRVEDPLANDGWALYGLTGYSKSGSGLGINFNHLDLSLYSSIYIRIRTTESGYGNQVTITANGTTADYNNGKGIKYGGFSEYTLVDILPKMLENGETHLDYLEIARGSVKGIGIYVDEISFVKKEDAPVYEDFTITGEELLGGAGCDDYKNFEGGNLSNVENIALGEYQGRENVVTMKTTAHMNDGQANTYSGGGIYIDFSSHLTSGKIVASQNFTISISVYMPSAVGNRVGAIWGTGNDDISYKNSWQNPYGGEAGWKTITVTGDTLRALSGCSDKEITGIYIGVSSIGYTFAIDSVSVSFGE